MTDPAAFWNRKARAYAAMPMRAPEAWEETVTRVLARLPPEAQVLEVGCGTGTTALRLAPHVAHVTATDLAGEMIAIAEEKRQAAGVENVTFRLEGGEASEGGPYDAVIAFNLLHLVPDMPATLTALRGHLRPGGLLAAKSFCVREARWFVPPLVRVLGLVGVLPRMRALRAAEFDRAIRDAGLEVIEASFLPHPSRLVLARRT